MADLILVTVEKENGKEYSYPYIQQLIPVSNIFTVKDVNGKGQITTLNERIVYTTTQSSSDIKLLADDNVSRSVLFEYTTSINEGVIDREFPFQEDGVYKLYCLYIAKTGVEHSCEELIIGLLKGRPVLNQISQSFTGSSKSPYISHTWFDSGKYMFEILNEYSSEFITDIKITIVKVV